MRLKQITSNVYSSAVLRLCANLNEKSLIIYHHKGELKVYFHYLYQQFTSMTCIQILPVFDHLISILLRIFQFIIHISILSSVYQF